MLALLISDSGKNLCQVNNYADVQCGLQAYFGYFGIAVAIIFARSAIGTAKSGVGICATGVLRPDIIMKSIIPVVMAGILGIYGLIISVILNNKVFKTGNYHWNDGFKHMASGLCCGLSSLGAGLAIGFVGDAGVRANGQSEGVFVGMVLILIFAEALGLYGMIVAIILAM